jgi:small nuclear ribonucleoprotein (snRNP)-like protein
MSRQPVVGGVATCSSEEDFKSQAETQVGSTRAAEADHGALSLLCFFSTDFDPWAALAAPLADIERLLPTRRDMALFRKAAPLDRVHACASLASAPFRTLVNKPRESASTLAQAQVAIPVSAASPLAVIGDVPWRRDVRNRPIARTVPKNVLREMNSKYGANGGPLAFLLNCFERRSHVCIVLRRSQGLRGRVVGVLEAFDRHLNVVLGRASIQDSVNGMENGDQKVECQSAMLTREEEPWMPEPQPPRYVRQLFVRGDNVVAICRG